MAEQPETDNEQLLQAVARATESEKNELDELLTLTRDQSLKTEMLRQKREICRIGRQAHTALAALGSAAQGQNAAARMARSMALRTRTMLDKSTRNLAGLLAEEAGRTAAACRRAEDGCPQASAGAQKLSRELAELASGAEQAWRAFL